MTEGTGFANTPEKAILMADLDRIYEAFSSILSDVGMVYVAGGAVRDTLNGRTPKDYDVFVLCDEAKKVDHLGEVQASLQSKAKAFYRRIEDVLSMRGFQDNMKVKGDSSGVVSNVTYNTSAGPANVQVILSFAPTVYSLLEDFDWNICLFAYGWMPHSDTVEIYTEMAAADVVKDKELVLNKLRFPYRAMRRAYRFSERYEMRIERESMQRICKAILANPSGTEMEERNIWEPMKDPNGPAEIAVDIDHPF